MSILYHAEEKGYYVSIFKAENNGLRVLLPAIFLFHL